MTAMPDLLEFLFPHYSMWASYNAVIPLRVKDITTAAVFMKTLLLAVDPTTQTMHSVSNFYFAQLASKHQTRDIMIPLL